MYDYLKHGRVAGVCAVLFLGACSTKPAEVPHAAAPVAAPQVQSSIVPGSEQDLQTNVGDTVHFEYNRSDLQAADKSILQRQATWLEKYVSVRITVQGNCDERGTREYNLALGARRAEAVKEYLASLGVSVGRISTVSYGKERPICAESTEACWAKNRRAVTVVTSGASS
ncbi:MAG: peptidoglycan-associated lipoprotein Pal [Alphaproteobacteria bacterium]|nr:peptidoglycan-associated lipoprotein Pal [Alphaproteobacteria bacterium]MDE2111390.1 peptidoglycan-associated lipoprotein Pal [Alphaproteobacteria bacterium]MDE2495557.1 peptidoglycan-associated lipoprotein Pal [Alphaproteobacteria bacterium]